MTMLQAVLSWMTISSVMAFLNFAWDKRRAERDRRRVPERVLLAWSVCGGAPGAILAMVAFRHKTRKFSFWAVEVAALGLWGWGLFSL